VRRCYRPVPVNPAERDAADAGISVYNPERRATTMVTGFNTDVKYKGVTYHVQTEDKGPTTPMVLTLIYKGGEILGAKRFHYKDVPEAQDDKGLAKLMEDIHAATMNEVKQGRYAPQDDKTVIEDLSLDQLVLAYLASRAAANPAR
jgi:hypothetical protein